MIVTNTKPTPSALRRWRGADYLIAPVVMSVAPRLFQSGKYCPSAVLEASVPQWAEKPVTVGHPPKGLTKPARAAWISNHKIGYVRNVRFDAGKLVGEAWLDPSRLKPRLRRAVERGNLVDVSIGYHCHSSPVIGSPTLNGHDYTQRVTFLAPDHLALLPTTLGACTCAEGCGLNAKCEAKCGAKCRPNADRGMNATGRPRKPNAFNVSSLHPTFSRRSPMRKPTFNSGLTINSPVFSCCGSPVSYGCTCDEQDDDQPLSDIELDELFDDIDRLQAIGADDFAANASGGTPAVPTLNDDQGDDQSGPARIYGQPDRDPTLRRYGDRFSEGDRVWFKTKSGVRLEGEIASIDYETHFAQVNVDSLEELVTVDLAKLKFTSEPDNYSTNSRGADLLPVGRMEDLPPLPVKQPPRRRDRPTINAQKVDSPRALYLGDDPLELEGGY